jgi:hypothetical protein|tara:strand:- start:403 stop:612 length:210 start_codon:yes stop_codon:yes gene_type:complete
MLISRQSIITGEVHEMEIDVEPNQLAMHAEGALAQVAFPHLPSEHREFLISGITPDEWIDMNLCEDCEE